MKKKSIRRPSIKAFISSTFLPIIATLLITLYISSPGNVLAGEVTLQWDSSELAIGYKLYYGIESQSYDSMIDVGSHLQHTISNLIDGQRYYFAITAYNDFGESNFSEELVHEMVLNSENQPPTADAGPNQTVNEFAVVTLNGSNSIDPDDGIAAYYWEQMEGPLVELTNQCEEVTTFTAPDVGSTGEALIFRLTVMDYGELVSYDTCVVNVSFVNSPPIADAGPDKTVSEGELVVLDGSNSTDQDDGINSYQWTQISGTPVELSVTDPIKPTFISPNVGSDGESLQFQLTVADNGGLQTQDTCIVNVSWINDPPTADAGPDQIVQEGDFVTLDGSKSTDLDDGVAACQWTQTSGPPVNLSSPAVYQPTFTAPAGITEGINLTFDLTVSDYGGLQSQDSCTVTVDSISNENSDNVQIIEALYQGSKKILDVTATSDAPVKSVLLSVWAEFGEKSVNLGELKYDRKKKLYKKVFRRINSKPINITVISSGGGSDSQACSIR
jgi:hypothetical protein